MAILEMERFHYMSALPEASSWDALNETSELVLVDTECRYMT